MLPGLITIKQPPAKRAAKAEGGVEKHLTEAAVMLAYAFYLSKSDQSLDRVEIHRDGEHGKQFDIRSWLETQGFSLVQPEGSTSYGGEYSDGRRFVHVSLKPGLGDVVAETDAYRTVAECKGGIVNSKHAGQKSRLRRGLCEAVGLLISRPRNDERQFAVVPQTGDARILAARMYDRCKLAGIGIRLVGGDGAISEVGALNNALDRTPGSMAVLRGGPMSGAGQDRR